VKDGPRDYELFGFLTTESNGIAADSGEGNAGDPDDARGSRDVAYRADRRRIEATLPDSLTTIVPAPPPVEDVKVKAPEQPSLS
jgi:hypothetical protein